MNKCTQCGRTDADLGTCGQHVTCPILKGAPAVPVDLAHDVVLHCDPCGFTRVVAVTRLTHNQQPNMDVTCQRGDECACIVIHPVATTPATDPMHHPVMEPAKRGSPKGK